MLSNLITMGNQMQTQPQKELKINNLMMGNGLLLSSAMRIEDLVKLGANPGAKALGRGIRIS